MSTTNEKPVIRQSGLSLMSRCPEAFRRRVIEGEVIPPGIAALKGTGTHKGIALNFRQKIESHEDLPVKEIVDASVAAFETELHGGYMINPDDGSPSAVIAKAKDSVASLSELHAVEVSPAYQPVLVEETVRLVLPGSPMDLSGTIDMADHKRRVIDHKTTGKRKSQSEADSSVQLTLYSVLHQVATGLPASEVRLEVLVDKKTPERQVLSSDRGPADFDALAARVNTYIKTIQAGVYVPTTPDNWMCSARWCGFYTTCPYVNGSRPVVSLPTENLHDKEPRADSVSSPEAPRRPKRPKKTIDPDAAPIVIQSSSSGGRPGPFVRKQRPKMKLKSE